jgi:hypothetical protein
MFSLLCIFSISAQPKLSALLLGEWSGILRRNSLRFPVPFTRFTIEFHPKSDGIITEGSLWRDDLNSTDILPIEHFLFSHFEVEFDSELTGQVFKFQSGRSLLTKFEIRPFISGDAAYTKLTFARSWWIDLTLYNGSYFTAVLSAKESSGTAEYSIARANVPIAKPERRFGKWSVIGGIVIGIQIIVFWGLKRYNASLTQQLDDLKSQVVIDLDAPKPQRKKRKNE